MKNETTPIKLKVLIPVRNRLETLQKVVELILKVTEKDNCSLVVSSNNCAIDTLSYLESTAKNNKNFCYLTSNVTLSMAKNFERLIRFTVKQIPKEELNSTWLYVTGADDGLTRQAFPEIQKAVAVFQKFR